MCISSQRTEAAAKPTAAAGHVLTLRGSFALWETDVRAGEEGRKIHSCSVVNFPSTVLLTYPGFGFKCGGDRDAGHNVVIVSADFISVF